MVWPLTWNPEGRRFQDLVRHPLLPCTQRGRGCADSRLLHLQTPEPPACAQSLPRSRAGVQAAPRPGGHLRLHRRPRAADTPPSFRSAPGTRRPAGSAAGASPRRLRDAETHTGAGGGRRGRGGGACSPPATRPPCARRGACARAPCSRS